MVVVVSSLPPRHGVVVDVVAERVVVSSLVMINKTYKRKFTKGQTTFRSSVHRLCPCGR